MREIDGNHDSCIFEWLLCIDLKGYFPRYILEQVNNETLFFNLYFF